MQRKRTNEAYAVKETGLEKGQYEQARERSKCDYPKEEKWKMHAVSQGGIKKGQIKTHMQRQPHTSP